MAELIAVQEQNVAPNSNVVLLSRRECMYGNILHREGSGIVTLRGITNCPNMKYAKYDIVYQANIALPTGAEATSPIALAIAIDGEVDPVSLAISTPGALTEYNSVSGATSILVPVGCCYTISLKNAPASTLSTYTQQPVLVQNANMVITRARA